MKEHDYRLESANLKNEYKEDYYVVISLNMGMGLLNFITIF